MKITIYSENEYGCGASIVAWLLAEAYTRKGHQVHFFYRRPRKNAPQSNRIHKERLQISDASLVSQLIYFFWKFWSFGFAALAKLTPMAAVKNYFIHLRRHFKYKASLGLFQNLVQEKNTNIQPDAIHLHDVLTFMSFGFIDKMSRQYRTIWTFHNCFAVKGYTTRFEDLEGNITESCPDLTFEEINLTERNKLFTTNDQIQYITPSRWLHDLIKSAFSFPENLHVIHNGLSPVEFQVKDKLACRKRLGWSNDKKYALTIVGELHLKHKNFYQLKNAFDKITDKNLQLVVIGNQAKWTQPFPENITFDGPIYDNKKKNDYFCAADIFIIPSLADNFPTVILESMICGIPVLGSTIGGIPELVKPGITGQLFNPYDVDDLIVQMKDLLKNPADLQKMGEDCRTIAVENFTLAHISTQYLQLI